MICYKDKSFCSASEQCNNKECYRYFGEEQREAANKWWGCEGAPIAFTDFYTTCEYFDLSQMTKEQLMGQGVVVTTALRENLEEKQ